MSPGLDWSNLFSNVDIAPLILGWLSPFEALKLTNLCRATRALQTLSRPWDERLRRHFPDRSKTGASPFLLFKEILGRDETCPLDPHGCNSSLELFIGGAVRRCPCVCQKGKLRVSVGVTADINLLEFSKFIDALEEHFSLSLFTNVWGVADRFKTLQEITPESLSQLDCLFVHMYSRPLVREEVLSLEEWTKSGGALVVDPRAVQANCAREWLGIRSTAIALEVDDVRISAQVLERYHLHGPFDIRSLHTTIKPRNEVCILSGEPSKCINLVESESIGLRANDLAMITGANTLAFGGMSEEEEMEEFEKLIHLISPLCVCMPDIYGDGACTGLGRVLVWPSSWTGMLHEVAGISFVKNFIAGAIALRHRRVE